MKNPQIRLLSPFLIGALLAAGLSTASATNHNQAITPPAIKDGSNFSRAPFPAARQFDDAKVLAPATPTVTTVATVSTEPVLTPTGRETVFVTKTTPRRSAWDTAITAPAVKDGSNSSRAPLPAQRQFDDTK